MATESGEQREVRRDFEDAVNMAPSELEDWLETDESKAVGQKDGGETVGHASGRRIVELRRTKVDLTDDDDAHMRTVLGYVRRHLAQGPPEQEDAESSRWRASLMNWGRHPLR